MKQPISLFETHTQGRFMMDRVISGQNAVWNVDGGYSLDPVYKVTPSVISGNMEGGFFPSK